MPKMDSIEEDRRAGTLAIGGPNKKGGQQKTAIKDGAAALNQEKQGDDQQAIGLFEESPSSTVKDLQRKLDQINSPSESKVSTQQEQSLTEDYTETSIP